MNQKKENQKLIKKINLLAQIKPREEWKSSFRDILLSEIKAEKGLLIRSRLGVADYLSIFSQSLKFKIFQPAVAILVVLSVFLGSSLLVNAAFYSLPGDNLYGLKIALEKTQIALILDSEKKTELRMEFANNRVEEFERITNLRPESLQEETIAEITERFKSDVLSINEHINQLNQQQKPVFSLAKAVDSKTAELAKTLAANKEKLPALVKKQVEDVVNEAVTMAEDTSNSAFRIALNSYKEGSEGAEEEVIDLVKNKIENLEQKLSEIEDGDALLEAQRLIEIARELLEKGDFDQAVDKISQVQELVNQIQQSQIDQKSEENTSVEEMDAQTQTEELDNEIGQVLGQATSTESQDSETILETTEGIIE